jgi:hypothetical protein
MNKTNLEFILSIYDKIQTGRNTQIELDEAANLLPVPVITTANNFAKIKAINTYVIMNQHEIIDILNETTFIPELPKDQLIEIPDVPVKEPATDRMAKARAARKTNLINNHSK